MTARPVCWLAKLPGAGPCDGRLVRAHLIARQVFKTELVHEEARAAIDDPRSWVWACGGPTGVGGHHGMLDYAKTIRIPRHRLPEGVEALAGELELGWWLDRTYGPVQPFIVEFENPAVGLVVRRFGTEAEAQERVRHYEAKYGAWAGYEPAQIVEVGS